MTDPSAQTMLELADELDECNAEARAFKPHPYMRMMERAAIALREVALRAAPAEVREEAEGYAASLRQQAQWIDESREGKVSVYERITLEDIDTDELRAAADFIDRTSQLSRPEHQTP